MDVADATVALSPIWTYIEFKISPTPKPNPPAANPIKNPMIINLAIVPGKH